MVRLNRRGLMKFAVAGGALLGSGGAFEMRAFAGTVKLERGGKRFGRFSGNELARIPTSCWSCVTRDAVLAYVDNGRLVRLEGHPDSIRCRGKICAKGHAGVNQVYDPDRILYPLRRAGKRGEGQWKRISWDEALTEIAGRLKKLRDAGTPEKFMFHYGRMKSSNAAIIQDVFLKSYGTDTIGDQTAIGDGGKWVAQELTWGKSFDNWDFENTKFILNFGSSILEAGTNHIPLSQRFVEARVDRGVRAVTFDVRLSDTAAKSDEWIPIRPGTDGGVALAMCNVIMRENLYDKEFLRFVRTTENLDATVEEKAKALKDHLAQYTPEWAEKISGVPAAKIQSVALEFAKAKPAVVISYRGAVAHYNGNETERAIQTLAAITGNVDNPGGRCRAVFPKWVSPPGPEKKPEAKKLNITNGAKDQVAFPSHGVCHQIFKMIKNGGEGRPEVYMWYCHNPAYAYGDLKENIEVLKDENLLPFTVCVSPFYDESAALADVILPDVTYLEKWDWEDAPSATQVAEFYIRQPVVKPLGESRDFCDVVCDLAERMGFPLGFKGKEEFVRLSCEMTPEVKAAGGFEFMKKQGVYHDPKAKPKFYGYKEEVNPEDLKKEGVILDEAVGVYWNWKKSKAKNEDEAKKEGFAKTGDAYKGYVGQKMGDKVFRGFEPDHLNKTGFFEVYSALLKGKGFSPLPAYIPIPEHENLGPNRLILTTYKVPVHIHSRSMNCKWLAEIYHENPARIHWDTATKLGIQDGNSIRVKSDIGEITTTAKVTGQVAPGVIAISHHCGHWEYGRYASGKKAPYANDDDPDLKIKWWQNNGVHPNWILPNKPDPINGQMRYMDTVVQVSKV